MAFEKQLKRYFQDHHLNQSSVARDMHMDVSKLNATLNGGRSMKVEELIKLCQVLHVDPNDLINY